MSYLRLVQVSKSFVQGEYSVDVLKGVNIDLKSGSISSLVGPSGCGKSTLLHIAGLLESPTSGEVIIDGVDCASIPEVEATQIRGEKIGFVYQFHHLLGEFTALENVMMPLLIRGYSIKEAQEKATDMLAYFSLGHRLRNIPTELSGGEQQRVAIARALVHNPKIILADEPTGNLDEQNAEIVFQEFLKIARTMDVAVLIVTHNLELAKKTDRILTINNGVVEELKHHDGNGIKDSLATPRRRVTGTKSKAKKS